MMRPTLLADQAADISSSNGDATHSSVWQLGCREGAVVFLHAGDQRVCAWKGRDSNECRLGLAVTQVGVAPLVHGDG
jgi:hypothetical protein